MANRTILYSNIRTVDPRQPNAEAMAIEGERILAVGSRKDIQRYQSGKFTVLNLPDRLIVPGFIDSHVHFLAGGMSLSNVALKDAATKEAFIRRIRDYVRIVPSGEWILLGFWDHENWGGELPTCQWIDAFTRNNPVFLSRSDSHMALANTAAMQVAGIAPDIPEPAGGAIGRLADGSPNGIFKDNAMQLISRHIPDYSSDQNRRAVEAAMKHVAARGVTSVHHMGTLTDYAIFKEHLETDGLSTRIYCTAPLSQYPEIVKTKAEAGIHNPWLTLNGAKIFADGSLGARTAAFMQPYQDAPGESGLLMDDPEQMRQGILAADKLGLQVLVHAIGDRANHLILNFFEECIRENGQRDRRLRIEHAQHLLPEDISRFGKLGVIASMQPWHLMDDARWADRRLGTHRTAFAYPFRTLLDTGAKLAFGSDWFVAPPSPLEGIYAALTRRPLDGTKQEGWTPSEKITVEEALRAYTLDAAFASFDENSKGSLEAGKLADFVVLDTDIFKIDPIGISNASVLATFVGGKAVYKKENSEF